MSIQISNEVKMIGECYNKLSKKLLGQRSTFTKDLWRLMKVGFQVIWLILIKKLKSFYHVQLNGKLCLYFTYISVIFVSFKVDHVLLSHLYHKNWAFIEGIDGKCWFKIHLKPLSVYFKKFMNIIRSEQNRSKS